MYLARVLSCALFCARAVGKFLSSLRSLCVICSRSLLDNRAPRSTEFFSRSAPLGIPRSQLCRSMLVAWQRARRCLSKKARCVRSRSDLRCSDSFGLLCILPHMHRILRCLTLFHLPPQPARHGKEVFSDQNLVEHHGSGVTASKPRRSSWQIQEYGKYLK